jgi:hypothetical protein
MDIIIKTILCDIIPNVLYITMDIVIKIMVCGLKHSDVLRATMDIVIKTIIEDEINNLVITISE